LAGCSRVTDTGLAELNERAGAARKTLVRLDVSRLVQITGATFEALPETLEELDMSGCREITDPIVKKVVSQCPKLHTLHMRRCPLVGDAGIKCIMADTKVAARFRALSISGLNNTQSGLAGLAQMKNVIALDIAGNPGVSDGTVAQIARNCEQIERLDLTACDIGDLSLQVLGSSNAARAIRHLCLAGCRRLTADGLEHLYKGLPRMTFLNLQGCINVPPESIARMAKARPLVQVCGAMPVEKRIHWTQFEKEKPPDAGKKKKGKKKKKKKK